MRLYSPKQSSIVGGHLGRVVNTARKFAKSNLGRKIGVETKKHVLQAGSNVLNKVLSGEQSMLPAIKTNVTNLRNQLNNSARKRVKNLVLGPNKKIKRKLGGLTLYKLNKRKKSPGKEVTRYKLNKGKLIKLYKLNKRGGKKPPEGVDNRRYKLNPKKILGGGDTQRYKLNKKKKKGGKRRKKGVKRPKKTSRISRGRQTVVKKRAAKRRFKKRKKRPKNKRAVGKRKRLRKQKNIFGS